MVKRWEALGDGITDAGIAIFLEKKRPGAQQSGEWIQRQRNKIEAGIVAAARDLADRDYCHGVTMTIGDIAVGCALLWLEFRLPELDWRENHPNLRAWIERLEARQSFIDSKPPGA
jgi:glutathione S-transferase